MLVSRAAIKLFMLVVSLAVRIVPLENWGSVVVRTVIFVRRVNTRKLGHQDVRIVPLIHTSLMINLLLVNMRD